jgi:hypothetical protein
VEPQRIFKETSAISSSRLKPSVERTINTLQIMLVFRNVLRHPWKLDGVFVFTERRIKKRAIKLVPGRITHIVNNNSVDTQFDSEHLL